MKASLEFDLPDDQDLFTMASNAHSVYSIIFQLDQYLRGQIKYAPDDELDAVVDAYQHTRDKLYQLLNEHNISI
jgi:hypothetical protein